MPADSTPTLWWVRRDFRLADNPALGAAIQQGSGVLPLFVLDPVLLRTAGTARLAWMVAALHVLDADLRAGGGLGLSVVRGRPDEVVTQVAQSVGAGQVQVSADFAPYGRARDTRVSTALSEAGIELRATGSPYAVAPGSLRNQSGLPYQVFTPFHRAWLERGVHGPAPTVRAEDVSWLAADQRERLPAADPELVDQVGETVAIKDWRAWVQRDTAGATDYDQLNNFPGRDATSHLSKPLRWGHLHPRTVLADLAEVRSKGALAVARQVAWRDFHADVLFHRPDAVTEPIRPEFKKMTDEDPDTSPLAAEHLRAWQHGRTGFPLVDAGMRQLVAENWMHNRVRLVVASFLIKDLHIGWRHGARWFMEQLHDGDIAQNQLNWQWVAGCGTDAAPYFRIFNPTGQAEKFDADGSYIRRYVPELAEVPLTHLHEPWTAPGGPPAGYPAPIVEHAAERRESLERYAAIRS